MKHIVAKIILYFIILIPTFANAQNTAKEPTFIKNDKGAYVNRESLKMKPESYKIAYISINGESVTSGRAIYSTVASLFSKERVKELREYSILLVLNFDTVKKLLANVYFKNIDKNDSSMPFTDDEMKRIEDALKALKWEYDICNKDEKEHDKYFLSVSSVIHFTRLKYWKEKHEKQ